MERSQLLRKANAIIAQLETALEEPEKSTVGCPVASTETPEGNEGFTAGCCGDNCKKETACDNGNPPEDTNASLTASIERLEARIAAEEKIEAENNEIKSLTASINDLESRIATAEKEEKTAKAPASKPHDQVKKECCKGKGCKKEEEKEKKGCKTAAIEDEIGDEAHGGDPSVSDLPKLTDIAVDTLEGITASIDRIATALEKKGFKRLAFRLDQVSDKLENFK